MKKELIKIIIGIALVVGVVLLFASCSSVKKSSSKFEQKIDSVNVKKSDSVRIKKVDSVGSKTEAGSYTKETVYLYDTLVVHDTITGKESIKYVPRIIKVTETGQYNKTEDASQSSYDSSGRNAIDSTSKGIKTVDIASTKTRTSNGKFWAIIVVFIIIAIAVYLSQKKLIKL